MTGAASRTRWLLLALFGMDLCKHAALLALGLAQPWGDSGLYWQLGHDVARGDFWLAASQQAFRTPGYPYFLAIFIALLGPWAFSATVLMQHGLTLLTSWLTSLLTYRVTQSERAMIGAYALCAISTARPAYANWILTEALAACLLTASALQLVTAIDRRRLSHLLAASVLLGLGVLVRPSLLAAAPALAVAEWWVGDTWRRRAIRCLLGPAIVVALLTPWCFRNLTQFDRFAPTVFTGRELWTAHFSPWPGGELTIPQHGAAAELRRRIGAQAIDLRHNWSVTTALQQSGLNDAEADALMEQVAWQAIRAEPGRAIFRTMARCATFWYVKDWEINSLHDGTSEFAPGQRRWLTTPAQSAVFDLLRFTPERWFPAMWLWSAATACGVIAMCIHHAERRVGIALGLIFATTTVLTAALEIPLYRYRCVLEPLMIVSTVAGIRHIWGSLGSGYQASERRSDGAAGVKSAGRVFVGVYTIWRARYTFRVPVPGRRKSCGGASM